MNTQKLAAEVAAFLHAHDDCDYYEDITVEETAEEVKRNLTDVFMIEDYMKDIEDISDCFSSHLQYVSMSKPLLKKLSELRGQVETEQSKRMVSDTGYEIKQAIHIGDKEIVYGENMQKENGNFYFVGNYTHNELFGEYSHCLVGGDYLEAMQEFTSRVNGQIEAVKADFEKAAIPPDLFTADHCYPHDYKENITGKVMAVRAEVFRKEYRRGDHQLIYVTGGNGALPNPIGTKVYHKRLSDGTENYIRRHEILGEVKPECMPDWAAGKLAVLQAEKNAAKPNKDKKDRSDAR